MPSARHLLHSPRRDRVERGRQACRARRIFRSTISAASRPRRLAPSSPICSRAMATQRTSLAFVASPLGRARSTMELVRDALELPPRRLSSSTIGCARSATATGKVRRWRRWSCPIPNFMSGARPTNGPCRRRAARAMPGAGPRMRDWYDQLRADTVAVAHGGTVRALMVALGHRDAQKRRRADHRAGRGLRVQ